MIGFWALVATIAVFYLWLNRFARHGVRAARGRDSRRAEATQQARAQARDDFVAGAEAALESWLLQPERVERRAEKEAKRERRRANFRPDPPSRRVSESTTAVMRKQIPPRDEAPRSWLGGLPMLPVEIDWPRGVNPEYPNAGDVPLHFIAQIACADLPPELWGGLGPRTGWLRLFVNGNTSDNTERGAWRLIFSEQIGEERQPPSDIGPIHDGVHTGWTPYTLRESVYPRWPVDIVAMPNELRVEEGRSLAAPADLARRLYPNAAIEENRYPKVDIAPFTWRSLAIGIDAAIAKLTTPSEGAGRHRQEMRNQLAEPGILANIVPALLRSEDAFDSQYADMLSEPDAHLTPEERERRANMRAYAAERRGRIAEIEQLLSTHPTPGGLLAFLDSQDEEGWKDEVATYLAQLRDFAEQQGLDSRLGPEAWEQVRSALGELDRTIWSLARGRGRDLDVPVTLERRTLSAMTYLAQPLASAAEDEAILCYVDPARRSLVPPSATAQLEPIWRALHDNRPHRMGGYHDGLQSDAEPGPTDRLLLMQFAVDDELHWTWGDNGAVYCFIAPDDLAAGRFDSARFHLECH
jgi:uncharacterized protein YwqG